MQTVDLALKPPCEEYREILRSLVGQSGKTQELIAGEVGIEPANLSNLMAGRRHPLLDPARNRALAEACGQPSLAEPLQLAAEACHAMTKLPEGFRRQMALQVLTLEALMNRMVQEAVSLQYALADEYRDAIGKKGELAPILLPEALLAATKVVSALRAWWPAESFPGWDNYEALSKEFRQRLGRLSPDQQLERLVEMEVEDALEWVKERGDLDANIERDELVRRLARLLRVEETALRRGVLALEMASGRTGVGAPPEESRPLEVVSLDTRRRPRGRTKRPRLP